MENLDKNNLDHNYIRLEAQNLKGKIHDLKKNIEFYIFGDEISFKNFVIGKILINIIWILDEIESKINEFEQIAINLVNMTP